MRAFIVAASLALFAPRPAAQALSPADLSAAIEQGRAGKSLHKKCSASAANGFEIVIEGPLGSIMRASREARKRSQDFTLADVGPMVDTLLTVLARRDPSVRDPSRDGFGGTAGGGRMAYRADVVLRSKPPGVEPLLLKPLSPIIHSRQTDGSFSMVTYVQQADGTFKVTTPRGMGPFPGSDMAAVFDLAVFRALPADSLEVVVFATDAGEQRCKISEKDRRDLR